MTDKESKEYDINFADNRDKRTTLYIKNIPNKYSQDLLLEDIDQKFKNAYDFFYLPIDFEVRIHPFSSLTSLEKGECRLRVHQPDRLQACTGLLQRIPSKEVEEIQL
jgi:hypothetical protein